MNCNCECKRLETELIKAANEYYRQQIRLEGIIGYFKDEMTSIRRQIDNLNIIKSAKNDNP